MDDAPSDEAVTETWVMLSPLVTGLHGKCPRCGRGHIFDGYLTVRAHCEVCGLDYSFADPADGPAVFVQLFASVPGVVFVIMLEVLFDPSFWVLLAIGLPVVVSTTLLPLRPIKGWLIATQYTQDAQEAGTKKLWDRLHGKNSDAEQ